MRGGLPEIRHTRTIALGSTIILMTLFSPLIALAASTPAGTKIENIATVSFKDANGNAQPDISSNTVTTTVQQVAQVSIALTTTSQDCGSDITIYYPAAVKNEGNGSDTIDLAVSSNQGWTVTIYKDDGTGNGGVANDGIHQAGETNTATDTGELAADDAFNCFIAITVPSDVTDGTVDETTLTATSQFDTSISATNKVTTNIKLPVLTITKSVDKSTAKLGEIITYTITYKNSGSIDAIDVTITDTIPENTAYVPNSTKLNGEVVNPDPFKDGKITVNLGTLAPGDEGTITLEAKLE